MKKLVWLLVLVLLLTACAGPEKEAGQTENNDVLYKSSAVEITRLPPETERKHSNMLWEPLDEKTAYTINTLIVYGEIISVDEAVLTLYWGEKPYTENITLFQLRLMKCSINHRVM